MFVTEPEAAGSGRALGGITASVIVYNSFHCITDSIQYRLMRSRGHFSRNALFHLTIALLLLNTTEALISKWIILVDVICQREAIHQAYLDSSPPLPQLNGLSCCCCARNQSGARMEAVTSSSTRTP